MAAQFAPRYIRGHFDCLACHLCDNSVNVMDMTTDTPRTLTEAVADELTAIKAVRRDVTNEMLAQAASLSTRQVIRILQGKADISLPELAAFATVLQVDVQEIIVKAYQRI